MIYNCICKLGSTWRTAARKAVQTKDSEILQERCWSNVAIVLMYSNCYSETQSVGLAQSHTLRPAKRNQKIYEQIMELKMDPANLSKLHTFFEPPPPLQKHARLLRTLDQLSNGICHVTATCLAFAALKEDASVVTWGHRNRGGDSMEVTGFGWMVGELWMLASCHVDHFVILLMLLLTERLDATSFHATEGFHLYLY